MGLANSIRRSKLARLDLDGNPVSRPHWFVGQEVRVSHDADSNEWYQASITSVQGEKVLAAVYNSDGSQRWPHTWEHMEPESGFLSVMQTIRTFLQENRGAEAPIDDN